MPIRIWFTTLMVLPLAAVGAGAQSYTLKIRNDAAPGKSITTSESGVFKIAVGVSVGGMVVKEEKKSETEVKQFTETVLEVDKKGLKKYTRTYAKAAKGEGAEPKKLSYAGKTIVFERKGDKIVATAEGEGVDAKDLADLTKSANNHVDDKKLVPSTPVKVGDSWPIPKDALGAVLGELKDATDTDKVKVTGKLTKAYKKAGQQWGTIEINIAVPMVKFGPLTLSKPVPFQAKLTFDGPIDGSSTAKQTRGMVMVKGVSDFEQNGQTITLDISIEGNYREERSAEK
jgi:hypothetical protein